MYPTELRRWAVRTYAVLREHLPSQSRALIVTSEIFEVGQATLRQWARQAELGEREQEELARGSAEIHRLMRENAELRWMNTTLATMAGTLLVVLSVVGAAEAGRRRIARSD